MALNNTSQVKYACYTANASMSVVASLSPLLFITFHNLYNISFSMLGFLVLINFSTQLLVDIILSLYSHKFNISRMVKITPFLTAIGLFIYGIYPFFNKENVFVGLVIGTIIFSASGGLAEVLISPVIAELPSDNPQREISKLHSIYAWGVVVVVIISTLLLKLLGNNNWQYLSLIWMIVPLTSCFLFVKCKIPHLTTPEKASNALLLFRQKKFVFCLLAIFLGGASECTMSQWSSSYLEQALSIPKTWGDILGVAMFAVMLGLGRTLYSKHGKNIYKTLMLGAFGATVCYIAATVTNIPIVGLISCALTGFCVAMLWPGSLIIASDNFPAAGVAVFALMAAGGDLGGAVGPQAVGSIIDRVLKLERVSVLASHFNITPEQFSMKVGLFSATAFPLIASFILIALTKSKKSSKDI